MIDDLLDRTIVRTDHKIRQIPNDHDKIERKPLPKCFRFLPCGDSENGTRGDSSRESTKGWKLYFDNVTELSDKLMEFEVITRCDDVSDGMVDRESIPSLAIKAKGIYEKVTIQWGDQGIDSAQSDQPGIVMFLHGDYLNSAADILVSE